MTWNQNWRSGFYQPIKVLTNPIERLLMTWERASQRWSGLSPSTGNQSLPQCPKCPTQIVMGQSGQVGQSLKLLKTPKKAIRPKVSQCPKCPTLKTVRQSGQVRQSLML